MQIDQAQIARFKDWFWGRPSIQMDESDDNPFFHDLPIEVATKNDLPLDGDAERKYYVADSRDTYRFVDGVYHIIDVYQFGVDEAYRDTPRTHVPKQTIVDHAYSIPSIEASKVTPDNAALATLFNVMALTTDLEQIRRSKVYGYKTTLMEVLQKGHSSDKDRNVTEWFAREHSMLYRLLSSSYRTKEIQHKPVIDALFKHGYVLTWVDQLNRPVFKFEDFYVYL